jgi:titin
MLSWEEPPDNALPIFDYDVEWRVGGQWIGGEASYLTQILVDGLENGTTYEFRVAANNAAGSSPWSAATTATPAWTPTAPGELTAAVAPAEDVESGQVQLTWTTPSTANGAAITDYVIESSIDGSTWTSLDDGESTATTFTAGGLTNGTGYSFRVAAVNAVGTGPWSGTVDATPVWIPDSSEDLSAAVAPADGVGSGEVKLTWSEPSANGAAITDYLIESSIVGGPWTPLDDGESTETSFTVGGLTNGTDYVFRIAAVNAVGTGHWSGVVPAAPVWTPAAPGEVVAAVAPSDGVGSGEVNLTWSEPSTANGAAITDYVIESSIDGGAWMRVDDGESTETSSTVGGLTNGTRHTFRVAAVNAVGTGPWSGTVDATPVGTPAAPGEAAAAVAPESGVGSGNVRLTWSVPASTGGVVISDYVVQSSTSGGAWTTVEDGVSTATRFTVRGLTNGTRYRFRVAAENAVGTGAWSTTVWATPAWRPTAPRGLRAAVAPAAGVGSRQVKLTWSAPASTGGSRITDYVIQRSLDRTTWTTIRDGVSTSRSSLVGRLTNGTRYWFRAAAENAVGQGPWSVAVPATPRDR